MYSQYIEGQSLLHKMPVSVKLIGLILLILSGFMLHSLVFALIFFLCAIALIFVAGISPLKVVRKTKHIFILLFVGFIFNLLYTSCRNAAVIFLRLYSIALITQIFTMTTPASMLMDELERTFHIKNEYIVSMMIAMAFLPILESTFQEIRMAQTARGCDWSGHGLISRIKRLLPILIPLFSFSLRKAETLGEALTIKGYRGK